MPRGQSSLTRPLTYTLALATLLLLIVHLWSDRIPISIGDDSLQYHQIAMALRTGEFFTERPAAKLPIGFVVRTPGFPAVLALGEALAPDQPRRSVLISHTLVLLFLIAFLHTRSGGQLPILVSVLAIGFSLPQIRASFSQVATEWSAFAFSIALISATCTSLKRHSLSSLFLVAFLAAVDVLIKPTLVFLLAVPALLPLLSGRRLRAFLAVMLGLSPLWAWLGFNYSRFNQITLAPIAGYGLIFTGALVGGADVERFTDPTTRAFAHQFNGTRPRLNEEEIADFNRIPRPRITELQSKYSSVIDAAFAAGSRVGVDYVGFNAVLKAYSIEAIRLHPRLYLQHLVSALKNISLPILFLMALISIHLLLRNRNTEALAYSLLSAFFHVGLLSVTAIVQPIDPRYYSLSASVPYFYVIVILYLYGRELVTTFSTVRKEIPETAAG